MVGGPLAGPRAPTGSNQTTVMSPPPPGSADRQLFDFQVNGFGGIDFQQDDLSQSAMRLAVRCLQAHRVRAIFVTLISDTVDRLCRRLEHLEKLCQQDETIAGMVAGYHLEGPWLSAEPGYCGAHPPEVMCPPKPADFDRLQAAAQGRIRLVTIAPELPGSAEFISRLASGSVHVALGHTNANEAQIDEAIRAGARFCTHLGNAVPALLPRHDNVVQRLLARDELTACLIPDGVHVPPFVLRNFFRAKPPGRVLFTTDAMAGAGASPGRYSLGRLQIEVGVDGIARNPGGLGLAGSTLTPDEGVRRCASYLGLTAEDARRFWSTAAVTAFNPDLRLEQAVG